MFYFHVFVDFPGDGKPDKFNHCFASDKFCYFVDEIEICISCHEIHAISQNYFGEMLRFCVASIEMLPNKLHFLE